jgi:hypothetical protein
LTDYLTQGLSIIDLQGREVMRVTIESNVEEIDIKDAANGLYLIRIQNGVLPLQLQR